MVVLVAKECNIQVNASNEVRFIFGGSGVMVSAWWTICKTKTAEVPAAFESFQVHGQFPNQNYPKIESKFGTSLHRREGYIFELSRLRSFRESAWLQFRRTPMPLCKPCVDETERNRKKLRKCSRYFHMISQLVQSCVLVACKRNKNRYSQDIHNRFPHSTADRHSVPPNGRVKPGVTNDQNKRIAVCGKSKQLAYYRLNNT